MWWTEKKKNQRRNYTTDKTKTNKKCFCFLILHTHTHTKGERRKVKQEKREKIKLIFWWVPDPTSWPPFIFTMLHFDKNDVLEASTITKQYATVELRYFTSETTFSVITMVCSTSITVTTATSTGLKNNLKNANTTWLTYSSYRALCIRIHVTMVMVCVLLSLRKQYTQNPTRNNNTDTLKEICSKHFNLIR